MTAALLADFADAWQTEERLFALLDEQAYFVRAEPYRHPLLFYLGHTPAFYMNTLRKAHLLDRPVDAELERFFAQGIDVESPLPGEISRNDWPTLEATRDFRAAVKDHVAEVIGFASDAARAHWPMCMAIEHQRIHVETSSVIVRQLPLRFVARESPWPVAPYSSEITPKAERVTFSGGTVSIGRGERSKAFGWDNEFGQTDAPVSPFQCDNMLLSNGRFLEFVRDGGYRRRDLWTVEGAAYLDRHGRPAPLFWSGENSCSTLRLLCDEIRLPLDWPAEVSFFEVQAYLRWLGGGARLLSEAEHRFLLAKRPPGPQANLGLRWGSSTAVNYAADGSDAPVFDVMGNVWQWLADTFYPLDGFSIDPLYEDFSQPFFTRDHKMMFGGSWASTGHSASPDYRLWFRRFMYQHSGFRLGWSVA